MKVLRIYHSAVVSEWRERDRQLRATGVDITLVSARQWNEGGKVVVCEPGGDGFVRMARTWGHHPYLFAYDPIALWRALGEGPYEIVDVHEEPASLAAFEVRLLMALRRTTRRARLLLYCAQNIEKCYPIPFRWMEASALRHAAGVYCCNEDAGQILRRKKFRGALTVLGLGVDVERFAPSPKPTGSTFTIGYVGRLEEHKGVHVLIEALAKVPDAELRLVGDGPYRAELHAAAHRHGVANRVHLEGFATQEQLPDIYRSFDVLAVPSLPTPDWIEQFGRVAVEAMASGVPVVASASGSLPEVVGDAGLLVEPNDAVALADALNELANDREQRRTLSDRARQRAQRYSWASIAAGHRGFYERVLA